MKLVLRRGKASSLNGDFDAARDACAAIERSDAAETVKAEARTLLATNKHREATARQQQKGSFGNFFSRDTP